MPILAVTLGDEADAETTQAAVATAAAEVLLPMVSEAMREDVMHLFWANFEVSMPCCYKGDPGCICGVVCCENTWHRKSACVGFFLLVLWLSAVPQLQKDAK